MKESRRAAEDEMAHNRLVAWARENAGKEDAERLAAVRQRRLPENVARTEEKKILVEILDGVEVRKKGRGGSSGETRSGRRSGETEISGG